MVTNNVGHFVDRTLVTRLELQELVWCFTICFFLHLFGGHPGLDHLGRVCENNCVC